MQDNPDRNTPRRAPRFLTTRWSLVLSAAGGGEDARASLEELCRSYWYPLYAYVRRQGHDHQAAEDLTQGFFAAVLERRDLAVADPERGRFRSFLLVALRHHLANEWDRETALKRGGGRALLSIDWQDGERRFESEPTSDADPEAEFAHAFATATLERALERVAAEYEKRGQAQLFATLKPELSPGSGSTERAELAARIELTEGALKVALHRLRARFAGALRAEVAETLRRPEELEDELRDLLDALSGPAPATGKGTDSP